MFDMWLVAAILGTVCAGLWGYGYMRQAGIRVYMNRGDFKDEWQQLDVDMQEVERILQMLCTAYMLPMSGGGKRKINPLWCCAPSDCLRDLYCASTRTPVEDIISEALLADDISLRMFFLQLSDAYEWQAPAGADVYTQSLADMCQDILR